MTRKTNSAEPNDGDAGPASVADSAPKPVSIFKTDGRTRPWPAERRERHREAMRNHAKKRGERRNKGKAHELFMEALAMASHAKRLEDERWASLEKTHRRSEVLKMKLMYQEPGEDEAKRLIVSAARRTGTKLRNKWSYWMPGNSPKNVASWRDA